MRPFAWILAVLVASVPAARAQDAIDPGATANRWPQWQGRISLATAPEAAARLGAPTFTGATAGSTFGGASLLGDFYFGRSWMPAGQLGGFRATSGLMIGPRSSFALGSAATTRADGSSLSVGRRALVPASLLPVGDPSSEASSTVPYLGFGYTGLSVRSGFSYSADLGLAGGTTRLGRALGRGQSLDDAVRDLRMAPLAQVGVSYAF